MRRFYNSIVCFILSVRIVRWILAGRTGVLADLVNSGEEKGEVIRRRCLSVGLVGIKLFRNYFRGEGGTCQPIIAELLKLS